MGALKTLGSACGGVYAPRVATQQSDTKNGGAETLPQGWRSYQLPGGVPLLAILVPLAVIVLLFLQFTGRLSDGPNAEDRAAEAADSIAAALGLPGDELDRASDTAPCPTGGKAGSTFAEHVLRSSRSPDLRDRGVSRLTADTLDYFGLSGWGHRRYLAGEDRAVRGVRGDHAALVTLTGDSLQIRVVVGPCVVEALPEPAPPYRAG